MDPFRGESLRDRIGKIVGIISVLAVIGIAVWVYSRRVQPPQNKLEIGQVIALGGYTNSVAHYRHLKVRLPDGTIQLLAVPRDLAAQCRVSEQIAVYQVGKTYRVGTQGCAPEQVPKP